MDFKATLTERIKRTPSIESFRFKSEGRLMFLAGQFVCVIFDEVDKKNRNLNKYLSFSSSPTKAYFEITKRMSQSDFSKRLDALKRGDSVRFQGPLGNCFYKEEYSRIGFLIGGIGITPVVSILEYIVEKKCASNALLIYSNRTTEEIAFKKELADWQDCCNNIRVVFTVTDCEPEDNLCVKGRITSGLIEQQRVDMRDRQIFIFGPPAMVDSMTNLCSISGCEKTKIKTESFAGY